MVPRVVRHGPVVERGVGEVGVDTSRPVGVGGRPRAVDPGIGRLGDVLEQEAFVAMGERRGVLGDPVVGPAIAVNVICRRPMVRGSSRWVSSDARVQSAIGREKNSDLIRTARSGRSRGSAKVLFRRW
jgi:hypothetical protein